MAGTKKAVKKEELSAEGGSGGRSKAKPQTDPEGVSANQTLRT